jgi:hypothetical protein
MELFWIAIRRLPGEVEESNEETQVSAATFWVEIWIEPLEHEAVVRTT